MNLNRPEPFEPNENQISKDWKVWKKNFLIYLKLSGGYEKYNEEKRAMILLNFMGIEAIKVMEKISFNDENEKNDMDILLMKFDEIFDPPLNEVECRYKFFSRKKRDNETIEKYVENLKELAEKCNFGLETDKFILDMALLNLNAYLRETMFKLQDISLKDIIIHYNLYNLSNQKIIDATRDFMKNFIHENTEKMKSSTNNFKKTLIEICNKCGTKFNLEPGSGNEKCCNNCNKNKQIFQRACSKCGTKHPFRECPAYNETCLNCLTEGHYTSQCKQKEAKMNDNAEKNTINDNKGVSTDSINVAKKPTKPADNIIDCLWCGSKHVEAECPHYFNCRGCDSFPHNICFQCKQNPHNIDCYFENIILLPSIVSNNQAFKASKPLQNNSNTMATFCSKCLIFGHSSKKCSQNHDDQLTKTDITYNIKGISTDSMNVAKKPTEPADNIIDCLWCGSKHVEAKCPHNFNCKACNSFPHNVCFQCKQNPHNIDCYFKNIISLPSIVSNNQTNKPPKPLANNSNRGRQHCSKCLNYNHSTENCWQNRSHQSIRTDPLTFDYVKVEKMDRQHSYVNNKFSDTKTSQSKKSNKNDSCSIS